MLRIQSLELFEIKLPFRFTFKHSLASRDSSSNVLAKATIELSNNKLVAGWGESIPRSYVTGETVEEAIQALTLSYGPRLTGVEFGSMEDLIVLLQKEFYYFGLDVLSQGAAWCALELAILDACGKALNLSLTDCFGENKNSFDDGIPYGGVVPFSGKKSLRALLWFYRIYGFKTVKLKVGGDIADDIEMLRLARSILGSEVKLRVDANCAWTDKQTIKFAELARSFNLASIEQPVIASDLEGLKNITDAVPEQIVADESLCTISQAKILAEEKICSAFNIRISKVGGLLPAFAIARIAHQSGIACHLGAQVGESGILSAAGRTFAQVEEPCANYEGSFNHFLLKQDLTEENLTIGFGGRGELLSQPGLGVNVSSNKVRRSLQTKTLAGALTPTNQLLSSGRF
jgi:muconate cycloisomerase